MTRRHFETIAAQVAGVRCTETIRHRESAAAIEATCDEIARALASALAATNPRFDRDRFLAACAVSEPERERYHGFALGVAS